MKEYILTIVSLSIVSAVLAVVSTEKHGINKYTAFLASLLMALAVLSPLISVTEIKLPQISAEESENVEGICRSIAYTYSAYTGTKTENINISAVTDESGEIDVIKIKNACKDKELEEKLSRIYNVEVALEE